MMVKLTEKCLMGCSHCISNCTPDGRDMTLDVFSDVLDFYERMFPAGAFIISGGEPSENPLFSTMVSTAIERLGNSKSIIIIATNGMWIENDPDSCRLLLNYAVRRNACLRIQVTNDPRYYPRQVCIPDDIITRKEVLMGACPTLAPQGRAVLNFGLDQFTVHAPGCFNTLFMAKQAYIKGNLLKDFFYFLSANGKFCVPSVSITGEIKAGESDLCPAAASIYDKETDIFRKLVLFSCKNCKIGYEFLKKYHSENFLLNNLLEEAVQMI